jgi:hypothetical protein
VQLQTRGQLLGQPAKGSYGLATLGERLVQQLQQLFSETASFGGGAREGFVLLVDLFLESSEGSEHMWEEGQVKE